MADYSIKAVHTFEEGTVAILAKSKIGVEVEIQTWDFKGKPLEREPFAVANKALEKRAKRLEGKSTERKQEKVDQDPIVFAFFDKNNNGELDQKDQRVELRDDSYVCPSNARKVPGYIKTNASCVMNVPKSDIDRYGIKISKLFKQAKTERPLMPKKVAPQHKGACFIGVRTPILWSGAFYVVNFDPPLSFQTKISPEGDRYSSEDLRAISNKGKAKVTVDPKKCEALTTYFNTSIQGRNTLTQIQFDRYHIFIWPEVFGAVGLEDGVKNKTMFTRILYSVPFPEGDIGFRHAYLNNKIE